MFAAAWILIFPLALLHQGSAILLEPNCGVVTPAEEGAGLAHSPWIVQITTDSKICSGALINNQHVITAASCVQNKTKALVGLGDFTKSQTNSSMYEDYYVQSAFIHSLYNATTYLNNLAVLKLQRPVVYKPHIQPICISMNVRSGNARKFTAFLLDLKESNTQNSQNPNPIRVPIYRLHPNQCYDTFLFGLQNSQICAGTKNARSCEETGSPLGRNLTYHGKKRFTLLGIESYGRSRTCVYTDIMSYADWIVQNVIAVDIVT